PETPVSDEQFTQRLIEKANIKVLPGSYLSRVAGGINPGQNRVRLALVATIDECVIAAERLRGFMQREEYL
ncbi:MAG: N-succinyldiaminopimelate aminotransferase, partial [Candidatus Azotimanducaceae bacterium]